MEYELLTHPSRAKVLSDNCHGRPERVKATQACAHTLHNVVNSNMKLHGQIPAILHFLPECGTHKQSWQSTHPGFLGITWTVEKLDELLRLTPGVCQVHTTELCSRDRRLCMAMALLYAYGGVCITVDTVPIQNVQTLIAKLSNACIMAFWDVNKRVCPDIILAAPRLNTMPVLFQSMIGRRDICVAFSNFLACTAEVSGGTVQLLSSTMLDTLIHRPTPRALFHQTSSPLSVDMQNVIKQFATTHAPIRLCCVNEHGTIQDVNEDTTPLGALTQGVIIDMLADTCTHTVLIVDSCTFDKNNPVPHAITMALQLQRVLHGDCASCLEILVVVAHANDGGTMMIARQLCVMRGARALAAGVWQLGSDRQYSLHHHSPLW